MIFTTTWYTNPYPKHQPSKDSPWSVHHLPSPKVPNWLPQWIWCPKFEYILMRNSDGQPPIEVIYDMLPSNLRTSALKIMKSSKHGGCLISRFNLSDLAVTLSKGPLPRPFHPKTQPVEIWGAEPNLLPSEPDGPSSVSSTSRVGYCSIETLVGG